MTSTPTTAPEDDAPATPDAAQLELTSPQGKFLAQIPIEHLDHSPDNVREEFQLTTSFIASLKSELQVLVTVIPIPDDYERTEEEKDFRWWVVKGNRRLAGARVAELPDLECLVDLTKVGARAQRFIDQVVENDDEFRRGLTPFEQSQALFRAHKAGASRTEIRKRTGRTRDEVRDALATGALSEQTRQAAQELEYEWTFPELALLAEFDNDPPGLARVLGMVQQYGRSVAYAVELVRREQAEQVEYDRLLAELSEAGVTVTEDRPPGAMDLDRLARLVDGFSDDPHEHSDCAGHGAFFYHWRKTRPEFYCTTPEEHGHTPAVAQTISFATSGAAARDTSNDPSRKIVVEGNRAWMAASTVRQDWLATFLARKSAPKPVLKFVTRILNQMPGAVRDKLPSASITPLYAKLGGPADLETALASASAGRLAMLQLLSVAVAFEHQLSWASEECKNTWREGRHSPCSVADASAWLRFLVQEIGPELGAGAAYRPAPIEQALIDGVPYQGDTPTGQNALASPPAAPAEQSGEPAAEQDDLPNSSPASGALPDEGEEGQSDLSAAQLATAERAGDLLEHKPSAEQEPPARPELGADHNDSESAAADLAA